jgi:hypothetical protein
MAGMTTMFIQLLTQARRSGLVFADGPEGQLVIRGPRSCEPLVRSLLARKADVITVLAIYSGRVQRLDWRRQPILDKPQPCVLCGHPTLLIEPYDSQSCHKTCAEAVIRWGTVPAALPDGGRAA